MTIDVHAHHYPRQLVELMTSLGSGAVSAVNGAGPEISLEDRLLLFERNRIARQILSVGILTPDFADRDRAITAARLANDLYATACRRFPDRLSAFGTVPLPHADAAVSEARRCLDELGMLGIALGCTVAGRPLDDPSFAPLFVELDRHSAVVFLHPVGTGTGPHTADFGLTYMIGAAFEDTIAALRLILSGMTARHPRVRFIVPHLGGTAPFLLERLEYYVGVERERGKQLPFTGSIRDQLRRLWYDTINLQPAALRCTVEAFGADRLMLGTDYPFLTRNAFCSCVSYIHDAGLTASQSQAILSRNAQLLFGLSVQDANAQGANR